MRWMILSFLCALFAVGCRNEIDVPRRMPVRVAIADSFDGFTGWTPQQREIIAGVLPELDATGNQWMLVGTVAEADVTVRSFDSGSACAHGAGRYRQGDAYVEVDYVCTPSRDLLRYVTAHELMHWLTDRVGIVPHICRASDTDATCYPGLVGEALLNPIVPEVNDGSFEELGVIPAPRPTQLDLRLLEILGVP